MPSTPRPSSEREKRLPATTTGIARVRGQLSELRGRTLWIVVGGLICQLGLGYGYLYAPVSADITAELGWTRAEFGSVRIPQMIMMGLVSPVVGFLLLRTGVRPILVGSVVCLALGTAVLGEIRALWHFWLAAALQGIVAVGLGDIVVGAAVSQWTARGRGLALGLVYCGSNLAAMVLSPSVAWISTLVGWRQAVFVAGAAGALLMMPFALFVLREPGPDDMPAEPGEVWKAATIGSDADLDLRAAMRTRSFWALGFGLFSFFFVFVGVLDSLVFALRDAGLSAVEAGSWFGLATGMGIVGKIGCGFAADHLDHRFAIRLDFGLLTLATGLMLSLPHPVWMPIALVLFGIAFAARDVVYPLIIHHCFGERFMAQIYGALMVVLPSGALGSLFAGAMFDAYQSYRLVFATFAALLAASFLGLQLLRDERSA